MQIRRCMPRPNNWTPASKYFKMPFCLLLIVFRPQCEETRQEHVGVVWRAMGPACPQPSNNAIKNDFLLLRVHYQTVSPRKQTFSRARECSYHILLWYGCQVMPPSFIWWKEKEPLFSISLSAVKYYHIPHTQKIDFIKPSADVKPAGLNELCLFSCVSWGMCCMCVGKWEMSVMEGIQSGLLSVLKTLSVEGSAEDRKAPHHLLPLSRLEGGTAEEAYDLCLWHM